MRNFFRSNALSGFFGGFGCSGGSGDSGGDAGGNTNIAYGTFSIAGYPGSTTYEIEHGLGKRPKMFAVFTIEGTSANSAQDTLMYVSCVYPTVGLPTSRGRIVYGFIWGTEDTINFRDTINTALRDNYGIYGNEEKIILDMTEAGILLTNSRTYYWVAMSEEALA